MKKDLITHFSYLIALLILVSIYRHWLSLEFIPFWFGGILGTLLPDVDHLIYVYILKPNEEISQKISALINQRQIVRTWDMLASDRSERKGLIIHNANFQAIFIIFSFLVITSSGSLLGMGLVLAFLLHLLIDEVVDYFERGNFDNWFEEFPFDLDKDQKRWFLFGNGIVILILSFLL